MEEKYAASAVFTVQEVILTKDSYIEVRVKLRHCSVLIQDICLKLNTLVRLFDYATTGLIVDDLPEGDRIHKLAIQIQGDLSDNYRDDLFNIGRPLNIYLQSDKSETTA